MTRPSLPTSSWLSSSERRAFVLQSELRRLKQRAKGYAMINQDQVRLISNFKADLTASLSDKQRELIATFWASIQPTFTPVQKMVVGEILKVVR